MINVSMKELLESGVHFGHQTKRWNPKMKKYIFGERNGIYIIDLQKTLRALKLSLAFTSELASDGGSFLFVGTKRQAQDVIEQQAKRCGAYYVTHRWLGGTLTNFSTIRKSVNHLKQLDTMKADGLYNALPKKEVLKLEKERSKMEKVLCGIKEMSKLPAAIFIIDTRKEKIAVHEAKKLGIPVIAMVDTNCNPDDADHLIPSNDDAIRAIHLLTSKISDAILEGKEQYIQKCEIAAKAEAEAKDKETKKAKAKKAQKTKKETVEEKNNKKNKPAKKAKTRASDADKPKEVTVANKTETVEEKISQPKEIQTDKEAANE